MKSGTNRRLLVTGCPRSATKYTSQLLAALGRDTPHEAMGRDGIVSWCMAVVAPAAPWGPARQPGDHFETILHQVRNPALVIPSMSTLSVSTWSFVVPHTPCRMEDPLLLRAAKFWYYWNLHSQKLANWTYRVEDMQAVFPRFASYAGVEPDRAVFAKVGTNVNTRAFKGVAGACKWICDRLGCEPPALLRSRFVDRSVYAKRLQFDWSELSQLDPILCDRVLSLAASYGYTAAELGCSIPAHEHAS